MAFTLWMGTERLELSRVAPHAPQTCAYTSSATSPKTCFLKQQSSDSRLLSLLPLISCSSLTTRHICQAQTISKGWSLAMPIRARSDYFCGVAAGFLSASLAAAFSSFFSPAFSATGLALAAGEGEGETDGLAAGPGVVTGKAAPSRTTELCPLKPGKEKSKASSIKTIAAITVAFSKGFAAPRGPKADCAPAPPKAAATSPPLPDCKSTQRIRKMQVITKMALRITKIKAFTFLNDCSSHRL